MNLAQQALLTGDGSEWRHRPAFLTQAGPVSHGALRQRVDAVAAGLHASGLQAGQRIVLRLENSVEFAVAFLATVWLGGIPVLQNAQFGITELTHILDVTEPDWILLPGFQHADAGAVAQQDLSDGLAPTAQRAYVHADGLHLLDGGLIAAGQPRPPVHEASADTPAFIVFTSGSTGRPKGIVHAHRWLTALAQSNRARIPPQPDDVVLATGEWSFVSALGHNVLFPLLNGTVASIMHGRASPERILETIQRDRVTVLYSVATLYRRILGHTGIEHQYRTDSLRGINATGEPLEEVVRQEWETRFGCPLWEHYGISEAQMVIGHGPGTEARAGSVGRDWGANAVIVDDELNPVPHGQPGRLAFSAAYPGFFLGYLNDPDNTKASLRDGYYLTSDLAKRDEDGYVYILGRSDDCFKSKGVLIAPREVEDALLSLGLLTQACVFGIPDPEIGHQIAAVVVPRQAGTTYDASTLASLLAGQIAPYKLPRIVHTWAQLPVNVNGKVQRSEVARLFKANSAT